MKKLEELDCLSMVSNIGWRSFSDKRWSKGRKKEVQGRKKKRKKERKRTIGSNETKFYWWIAIRSRVWGLVSLIV